ncbi:MAG TPA: carboxyl transferase domain-containing protein, partial [Thermomicrobiales bacterium]|nr:carboxyl transferase domain-containing protein [Thermomicrobiales bacterium]
VSDAIITGIGKIENQPAVLVLIDHLYLGGAIGAVAGEKIALAMELAIARRLPLIAVCSGGGTRTQHGMLALVQLAKLASMAARLHRVGVPFVSVLTHPTTGGVYVGLANQADIIWAEPGARIGLSGARGPSASETDGRPHSAEFLFARGMVDEVVDRTRLRPQLACLLDLLAERGTPRHPGPLAPLTGGALPGWDAAALARHPARPTSLDYIHRLMPELIELHGDRIGGDDPAMICGIGRLDGVTVAVIGQERGHGDDAIARSGGRVGPAGFRKAMRLLRLASHLELPLITFIDSPGAMTGIEAEADGIGMALAQTLRLMSVFPLPIVVAVIGEGGSAGAMAIGVGDRVLMQERAIYAMSGFEEAGGQLHPAGGRSSEAPSSFQLTARDCLRLGVVDVVVPEPNPGAHVDADLAAAQLRRALQIALVELSGVGPRRLLDDRARRIRSMGLTTPEGREAARHEWQELQELQRNLSRSLGDLRDDLRGRWEHRSRGLAISRATLPARLHLPRPDLGELADRLSAIRATNAPAPPSQAEAAQSDEPACSAESDSE